MAQGKTYQRPAIALASLAFHALILSGLALHHGREMRIAAPEDVFAVTVLPRYLTPEEQVRRAPTLVKIHKTERRPERQDVPPLILPPAPPLATSQPGAPPSGITPEQLGQALRNGGVGCNPPGLPGLSREAREICEARLAAGARTAGYLGNGVARDKQAAFDQVTSFREWRNRQAPAGMGHANVTAEAAQRRNQNGSGRPGDEGAAPPGLGDMPHKTVVPF
ncbi:MAG: hypothetical protein CFE28_12075 [Alphaproteobacteria bacterium PA2]|nr:MAG: hypothetical protein CFE28_12075 [Alphaproteobacteria bacterium PA2]